MSLYWDMFVVASYEKLDTEELGRIQKANCGTGAIDVMYLYSNVLQIYSYILALCVHKSGLY